MQVVALVLVTPVPQGANWQIRKQEHKTDQVLLPTCIHSFVECGGMQVPHSPAEKKGIHSSLWLTCTGKFEQMKGL